VSNALSLLGNSIAAVALPLILLATTGDALAAGTLALICAVPQMAIGIVGGAALDRFNRRTISIASDLVSAASIALIPIVE
ncbi:MAG: MFS transporter, partial [Eggerthellaceae bacterium]